MEVSANNGIDRPIFFIDLIFFSLPPESAIWVKSFPKNFPLNLELKLCLLLSILKPIRLSKPFSELLEAANERFVAAKFPIELEISPPIACLSFSNSTLVLAVKVSVTPYK